jgi:hypothetical protein
MAWKISFSAQKLIFSCRKQINSWQFLDLKWSFFVVMTRFQRAKQSGLGWLNSLIILGSFCHKI